MGCRLIHVEGERELQGHHFAAITVFADSSNNRPWRTEPSGEVWSERRAGKLHSLKVSARLRAVCRGRPRAFTVGKPGRHPPPTSSSSTTNSRTSRQPRSCREGCRVILSLLPWIPRAFEKQIMRTQSDKCSRAVSLQTLKGCQCCERQREAKALVQTDSEQGSRASSSSLLSGLGLWLGKQSRQKGQAGTVRGGMWVGREMCSTGAMTTS